MHVHMAPPSTSIWAGTLTCAVYPPPLALPGMRRRLSVSLALLGDPAIVYLDEPTTGKGAKGRDKRRGKQEARKEH